jgi:Uma2 family endonuclease
MSTVSEPELDKEFAQLNEMILSIPYVHTDGEPMESSWHRTCTNLLIASILSWFRYRTDFYVGGNMFIYFNLEQARNRDVRGPDFFFVNHINLRPERQYWSTWVEHGRYPNVIIELLSPTTAQEDRTTKFSIYERTFRTPNYFLYDPDTRTLEGWQLGSEGRYVAMTPNERGWIWCPELELWLGTWHGEYQRNHTTWLRFYDAQEHLVQVEEEVEHQRAETERQRAETEQQRAETEHLRADTAEAEVARLRELLARLNQSDGAAPPPAP